ncbi:MAG TPA: mechanosensitive ion channel domain-containing protein [Anaerolineales bacterium]|nr:mechanosensitive ion channel domain-containing protein [Anaerolineales bacterium]
MTIDGLQSWLLANPAMAISGILLVGLLLLLFARGFVARGLVYLAARTKNKADDVLVRHLRPYRLAWVAPLLAVLALSYLLPAYQQVIRIASLFGIMWLSIATFNALLDALNEIYESSQSYSGVSIQSYLDIAKLFLIVVGLILSIALITGESPVVLLTGLGALMAVILLIFQNTILSLVASVQIVVHDLIKEGDWIEVPSYEADGDVENITLHTITVRNFDMTYTVIPTYRIVEVPYRNWRGMKESGGRRIQRSVAVDMITVKFCDAELLARLQRIHLIQAYMNQKIKSIEQYGREHSGHTDSALDGPQITNVEVFRTYIQAYLRSRADIHTEKMPLLVRELAPKPNGLPIELYFFTKTTEWADYEIIQAEVFDHILAAAAYFDLRVFQEPTGMDFSSVAQSLARSGNGANSAPPVVVERAA